MSSGNILMDKARKRLVSRVLLIIDFCLFGALVLLCFFVFVKQVFLVGLVVWTFLTVAVAITDWQEWAS